LTFFCFFDAFKKQRVGLKIVALKIFWGRFFYKKSAFGVDLEFIRA